MGLWAHDECPSFVFMFTIVHKTPCGILLIIQIIGYAVTVLSTERQATSFPSLVSVYVPCPCSCSEEAPDLISVLKNKNNRVATKEQRGLPKPLILKYPIGMAAEEQESGGYSYA